MVRTEIGPVQLGFGSQILGTGIVGSETVDSRLEVKSTYYDITFLNHCDSSPQRTLSMSCKKSL